MTGVKLGRAAAAANSGIPEVAVAGIEEAVKQYQRLGYSLDTDIYRQSVVPVYPSASQTDTRLFLPQSLENLALLRHQPKSPVYHWVASQQNE